MTQQHSEGFQGSKKGVFYAHSGNGTNRDEMWETVRDHLHFVSVRAAEFATAFGVGEQARVAGLLHDIGKYSAQFQRRLSDRNVKSRDHWTLGALAAAKQHKNLGHFSAVAILGHHVGLNCVHSPIDLVKDLEDQFRNNKDQFTTDKGAEAVRLFREDGFSLPCITAGLAQRHDYAGDMLDIRMLFSALVDADFVETEAHFEGDSKHPRRTRNDGEGLKLDVAITAFRAWCVKLSNNSSNSMCELRQQLLRTCINAGRISPIGAYTLSAPTGSGKTLAMLGFALEHAKQHGLRRIVLVMPFLNIIDQTAKIYSEIFIKEVFGEHYLLEAHSLAGGNEGDLHKTDHTHDHTIWSKIRRRLLAENWDAPIVLTTNVQLLESLFSYRPGACRKLHRLAESIVLFDEVQTLPPKLAVATLATLRRLSDPQGPYRSSVLFATATQPAFDALSPRLKELVSTRDFHGVKPTWQPTEIVADNEVMFAQASQRVCVEWQEIQTRTFEVLANELAQIPQVLCIVNLKRHALELARLLSERVDYVFHLSTNMCTAHRLAVLKQVFDRLIAGDQVRLIATQCVEAGVDIDFPTVYRAMAPLEAIAQAAGRCNRSGNRDTSRVIVFSLSDDDATGKSRRQVPPGYDFSLRATQHYLTILRDQFGQPLPEIIHSPHRLREYYRLLYQLEGRDQGPRPDEGPLLDAIRAGCFPMVANEYRLIEHNMLNVLVPYAPPYFQQLLAEATECGELTPKQIRRWIGMARPHSVSIYRPSDGTNDLYLHLLPIYFGGEEDERMNTSTNEIDWWYPTIPEGNYDERVGLQFAEPQWVM